MDVITLPLLLRWAGALLLTLCLMCLCLYLLQNSQDKLKSRTARRLKKLETLMLSRTNSAHLLEVDGTTYLAVTTPQHTALQKLETPEPADKPDTIARRAK